jgi:predicted DNA-binding antitoxin AbrB/MazE fold protein
MSQTIDATFESGTFKPMKTEALAFSEGQRVKLTVEISSPDEPTENDLQQRLLGLEAKYEWSTPQKALPPELANLSLPPGYESRRYLMADYGRSFPPPPEKKFWEVALEAVSVPPILWEYIVEQFERIKNSVFDVEPSEPSNKIQKHTRAMLLKFSGLTALLIYVVLLGMILKFIFILGAHNVRVIRALEGMSISIIPFGFLVILLCLLFVRALQIISSFIRSYRVLAIIGTVVAVRSMVKTSILLFTANSFSGLGGTIWEFVSGALK